MDLACGLTVQHHKHQGCYRYLQNDNLGRELRPLFNDHRILKIRRCHLDLSKTWGHDRWSIYSFYVPFERCSLKRRRHHVSDPSPQAKRPSTNQHSQICASTLLNTVDENLHNYATNIVWKRDGTTFQITSTPPPWMPSERERQN